jgi:hypothetical protein
MLDFSTALAAIDKLQTSLKAEDKILRQAVFAELSGQKGEPYHLQYLKISANAENKKLVAAELVRKSAQAEKDIEKLKGYLQSDPELLALLYAEVAQNLGSKHAGRLAIEKKVTSSVDLKNTRVGKLMARSIYLQNYETLKKQVESHQLETISDAKLARSIRARAALIEKVESLAQTAIQEGDWTKQLVTIDLLAKQSDRFYQELMSAPMPQGLSPEQEGEYLNLLSAQAMPFQTKALEAKSKVEQFWKNENWFENLRTAQQQSALQSWIAVEINTLKSIAPETQQASFKNLEQALAATPAANPAVRPSGEELATARRAVLADPLSGPALQQLMSVELRRDNQPMVQYLQTRLSKGEF